jgi:hypothetical protein
VVSFRKRDSDASRQPELAPVLPRDQLLPVQRPPYLVYLHVKDALAAAGEVVPAGQGDGRVRERWLSSATPASRVTCRWSRIGPWQGAE